MDIAGLPPVIRANSSMLQTNISHINRQNDLRNFAKKSLFFAMILQMILPKKKKKEMLRDLFCETTSLKDNLKGSQLSSRVQVAVS